jgi:hypothetical protein
MSEIGGPIEEIFIFPKEIPVPQPLPAMPVRAPELVPA